MRWCFAVALVAALVIVASCEEQQQNAPSQGEEVVAAAPAAQVEETPAAATENNAASAPAEAAPVETVQSAPLEKVEILENNKDAAHNVDAAAATKVVETPQPPITEDTVTTAAVEEEELPAQVPLPPATQDDEGEDLSYLQSIGYNNKQKVPAEICNQWHDDAQDIRSKLAAEQFQKLADIQNQKHFLESQMHYISRQIERQRKECTQIEAESNGAQSCDPYAKVRIAHSVEELQGVQRKLSELTPALQGEIAFEKQKLDSELAAVTRNLRECEKRPQNPPRDSNQKPNAAPSFATMEELQKWVEENDPESPAKIARMREEQLSREAEERVKHTQQFFKQFDNLKLPELSQEEVMKLRKSEL